MSKRYGNRFNGEKSSPAKRPKLDITKTSDHVAPQRQQTNKPDTVIDQDLWGDDDDFCDDAFEVIDNIASQAFSQAVNTSLEDINNHGSQTDNNDDRSNDDGNSKTLKNNGSSSTSKPSTPNKLVVPFVKPVSPVKTNGFTSKPSTSYESRTNGFAPRRQSIYSQRLASSVEQRNFHDETTTLSQFNAHLIAGNHLNSTVVSIDDDDDPSIKTIKLQKKNEKLMRDNSSSEGEKIYLRQKIAKVMSEMDKIKTNMEKQNQAILTQLEAKIKNLLNENDSLKKENSLKDYDLKNSIDRLKLIEKSSIKLTNPQTNMPPSPFKRPPDVSIKKIDFTMQTDIIKKLNHRHKLPGCYYPLKNIPQQIFETPLPEKSVVDIQITDKIGQKSIPILHDIFSSRIFENPLLVKPIVTVVNSKNLNVEFYLPELSSLIKKTSDEINSSESISMINKIILTSMELLLNTTVVLKTIESEMQNDDLKDMDDLYFSNFYKLKIDHNKSLCDAKAWYDKERGIESRRTFSILSHIARSSKYLSDFIAGKINLALKNDELYKTYSSQLLRYNDWQSKVKNHQVLKLINEFIIVVSKIRRSHQFTGLICSLLETLYSVDKLTGFNSVISIQYVCDIFKEIIFSRPLMSCFPTITRILSHFSRSYIFVDNLCENLKKTKLIYHNNERKFHYDSCLLRVFMLQLEKFDFDILTNIDIASSILTFVDNVFTLEKTKWPFGDDQHDECECREHVLTHALLMIYDMHMLDIESLERDFYNQCNDDDMKNEKWNKFKDKHRSIIKTSTRFLCSLAWLDHRFVLHAQQPVLEHKVQLSWDKLRTVNDDADVIDKYVAESVESKLILDREDIQLKNVSLSEKIYSKKHEFINKLTDESLKKKKWSNAEELYQKLF
ncbi:hypothetical protein HCN44_000903 [Aphidius gifuensis]|uniref:Uncharacterized protein n=1 Tax=Aphidius gifuensis TaxID=684658 RepID=A0A834XNA2_APHGI|nr:uncharacterized protein LOC122856647 [Aphidius gifuensis]KAF7988330.1 hypothetical protein HCN44_000903 [Aphidius gifuensis]